MQRFKNAPVLRNNDERSLWVGTSVNPCRLSFWIAEKHRFIYTYALNWALYYAKDSTVHTAIETSFTCFQCAELTKLHVSKLKSKHTYMLIN